MHIRDRIRCLDLFIQKVIANRNSTFSNTTIPGRLEVKREIKHSFRLPRKKHNSFHLTVKDKLSFGRVSGPFSIEVTVSGAVFLTEELTPKELSSLLKNKENINFLINQSLPYSCAAIAYLTDQMGFSPVILAPKYP